MGRTRRKHRHSQSRAILVETIVFSLKSLAKRDICLSVPSIEILESSMVPKSSDSCATAGIYCPAQIAFERRTTSFMPWTLRNNPFSYRIEDDVCGAVQAKLCSFNRSCWQEQ